MAEDDDDDDLDGSFAHFDIALDVAASLTLAVEMAERLDRDSSWKWLIVSTHMAAASAMVGYLTDSSGFGALTDKDHRALRRWLDESSHVEPPPDRIADFLVLLSRVKKGPGGDGSRDCIDIDDLEPRLVKLNAVRSRFNHFREEGWSIEKEWVLPLVQDAVKLVQRIAGHGWAFRHASLKTMQTIDMAVVRLSVLTQD